MLTPLPFFLALAFTQGKLEVVRIEDKGVVPFPPYDSRTDYLLAWKNDPPQYEMKKLQVVQPDGPSFHVEGHKVSWLDWSFHVGFNPREGTTMTTTTSRPSPLLFLCSPFGVFRFDFI